MKTAATFLEDYSPSFGPLAFAAQDELSRQDYETGCRAGWEDATKAQSEVTDKLRLDLSQRLQELAFTFHEARAHILMGLEPVLEQIVRLTVPVALRETFGLHLAEQMRLALGDQVATGLTLRVAPSDRDRIEAALPKDLVAPLELLEDETLAPGQSEFTFDRKCTQVDLSTLEFTLREAVTAYLSQNSPEEASHG